MGRAATLLSISDRWSDGSRDSLPKRQPEDTPSSKGEPLRCRKATWHKRHHFHHDDREAHHCADRGDRDAFPYAATARERNEGKAGRAPADCPNRGAHLADRHEHCVAKEGGRAGETRNECNRRGWSSERWIHDAERGMDETAPAECVHQPRGGDEVSMEHLEERQYGGGENQPGYPGWCECAQERYDALEMLRDDVGPRVHPRDDVGDDDVEQPAGEECSGDGP